MISEILWKINAMSLNVFDWVFNIKSNINIYIYVEREMK